MDLTFLQSDIAKWVGIGLILTLGYFFVGKNLFKKGSGTGGVTAPPKPPVPPTPPPTPKPRPPKPPVDQI